MGQKQIWCIPNKNKIIDAPFLLLQKGWLVWSGQNKMCQFGLTKKSKKPSEGKNKNIFLSFVI
jgi:hypothetical protein